MTRRLFSSKWSPQQLASTLNLPKTSFPHKPNYPVIEEQFRSAVSLYQSQSNWQEEFIIHDGPPFANGDLHIGHALNKMLKDTILRYHQGQGRKIQLQPGWDCHGLPIELRATSSFNQVSTSTMEQVLQIRNTCRKFALEAQARQQVQMQQWAVLADYEHRILTMDSGYVARQLRLFSQFVKRGLVKRRKHPVYWSPSSRTALAEAELEYRDDHISTACFVRFPVLASETYSEGFPLLYLLIWTTTPWTIPANQAIAFNPQHSQYCKIHIGNDLKTAYIVARNRVSYLQETLAQSIVIIEDVSANVLQHLRYHDSCGEIQSTWEAPFVTDDSGTGLVHIAPAYGVNDFQWYSRHTISNNPLLEIVDSMGFYNEQAPDNLPGCSIFGEAPLEFLRSKSLLLATHQYQHRYPYDWRTKKPVIQMATNQWHIDIVTIKEEIITALNKVEFKPESGRTKLIKMIESRAETPWCISRQRLWGVPIPVFYRIEDEAPCLDPIIINHVAKLIEENRKDGCNIWWKADVKDLLPPSHSHLALNICKGTDTFDVWFDSGTFWANTNSSKSADLYLEGVDQFRGWFQSSLISSVVACSGVAPFKTILIHGFVLDEKGNKMSKSIGNVVTPTEVIAPPNQPYRGIDVLRLWAVTSDYTKDITIGTNTLDQITDLLQKFRNTFRFLLGNLHDFQILDHSIPAPLRPLDRAMLQELKEVGELVNLAYAQYDFADGVGRLGKFVKEDLSAIYFDCIKNRLYLLESTGIDRIGAQSALVIVYKELLKALRPVSPFLCAEVESHRRFDFAKLPTIREIGNISRWRDLVNFRNNIKTALFEARQSGYIESTFQANVQLAPHLCPLGLNPDDLAELFLVRKVELKDGLDSFFIEKSNEAKCPRCWIYRSLVVDAPCEPCNRALTRSLLRGSNNDLTRISLPPS